MSWDVAVRAVIDFDSKALASWPAKKLKRTFAVPKTLPQAAIECATVGAALEMLEKVATYSTISVKKGGSAKQKKQTWTLSALLSEDDYLDHARTLIAVMECASTSSATGELLLYGVLTAPEGIAHRVTIGSEIAITKLSKAEEKKVLASRENKAFEAWVEKLVARDEAAAAKKRAPKTPSKFFEGMEAVRDVVEDTMTLIQNADDKALAKAVASAKAYHFHPKTFKTGRIIKNACSPSSTKFEYPAWAASDMLEIVHRLDPAQAEALCARLIEANDMPDHFRKPSARILHRTKHARRFVERLAFRKHGTHGGTHPEWWLREWAGYLATSKDVPTELLTKRLREALESAKKNEGAAQLVHYLAAALLIERKAWNAVPELARACYTHPDWTVRTNIGFLFVVVKVPVPIDAPRLDALTQPLVHTGAPLLHELWRRLRIDPGRALDELQPRLEAKDHAVSGAVASLLAPHMKNNMKPDEQRAVLAAEPRWVPFRKGIW